MALLAVGGGAIWWLWLRDGAAPGRQAGPLATGASDSTAAQADDGFWASAELQATIAAMDGGDWRSYPDLAAEQAAIDATLSGFAEAMQAGDLDRAVSHILPERQQAYHALFAANPEGMASFGALMNQATMSFLSEQTDTTAYSRTAEYALEIDGVTFYLMLIKTSDGWVLYDL